MKILLHFRHFPVAMGRFFHWGLQDLNHEVFTVGPYSNGRIPWGDQYYYPLYKYPPDYILPEVNLDVNDVLKAIPFKPDVIVQAADTIWFTGKAPVPNIILGTDPHVLDYTPRLQDADYFACMQHQYMKPTPNIKKSVWVPYGYDPNIHRVIHEEEKYDVVLCGLQYEHRLKAVEAMKAAGLRVFNALGLIYDEYVKTYNQGLIAFNWSSKEDIPARFWEGLAMKRLVLTNRVPDLSLIDFKEDEHYIAYSSVEEAVEKATYYASHRTEALRIATNGYLKVKNHTYRNRAATLLSLLK